MTIASERQITAAANATAALVAVSAAAILCLSGCQRTWTSDSLSNDAPGTESSSRPDVGKELLAYVSNEVPDQSASARLPTTAHNSAASPPSGKDLYARHCAACHGELGDGQGIAATYLFPKPRDLRAGRFRLVSTSNNVPTREDFHAVLLRGMPGSAMPPWAHLSQAERDALVDEVMRIRSDGAYESYVKQLKEDEDLTDDEIAAADVQEEISEYVHDFTTPGESTSVPAMGAPTDAAIARGKEVYAKFVCISCHGTTGRGDGVEEMWDDEKMPTRPRDFTQGIFKGNPEPASLYRRIAYGMPGTPMPGSGTMTPEQIVDLVHYIRSLSTDNQRQLAVLSRENVVAKTVAVLPGDFDTQAWSSVRSVGLRVTPLWWRDQADYDLRVQAAHDGTTVALRISWKDGSCDARATASELFEDALACQLYRGDAEPFLGMGSAGQFVDVWFWDADRQTRTDVEDQYPRIVADMYPFSEKEVDTAEYRRTGTSPRGQPEVSMPAVASMNQIVPSRAKSGGSDLAAGGPGSMTFRVPKSQLVAATGRWSDGRWTVVMRRSLAVASPEDGVSLAPGEKASVAFAIWDGSHHDRDGQKAITIWQDLELEP